MAVAKLDLRDMDFDLDGFLNAGGKVWTYAANTLDPLATYSDITGENANANPIVLDSSGQAHIFITTGQAYKFAYTDANDVPIYTENGILIPDVAAVAAELSPAYDVSFFYQSGPPTASEVVFKHKFARAVGFLANWASSQGDITTNPTSSFVLTVKKNGSTVGSVTISTGGVCTFATTAGAAVSFDVADVLTVHGPASPDTTAADFNLTFAGTVG